MASRDEIKKMAKMDSGREKWYGLMRNAGGILLALGVAAFSIFSTTELLEAEQQARMSQVESIPAQMAQIQPIAGQTAEQNEKKSLQERLKCWWTGVWTIREPRQDELTMDDAYIRLLDEKDFLMGTVENFPWDWQSTTLLGAELTSSYREDLGSSARWRMFVFQDPKADAGEIRIEAQLDATTGKILYLEMRESVPYSQEETNIQALLEAFGEYWGLKGLTLQETYKGDTQETRTMAEETGTFSLIATIHTDRESKERMQMIYISTQDLAAEGWTP